MLILALSLLVVAGCALGLWKAGFTTGLAGRGAPEWSDGGDPMLADILRKHAAPFIARGGAPGLVAAVVGDDRACLMGFGRPALRPGRTVDGDTLFEIGSIGKTFTGILLASEIAKGRVALEQRLQELLPPGVTLAPPGRDITLRHLATHTSGLPSLGGDDVETLKGVLALLLTGADPYAGHTVEKYLRDVPVTELEFPPGEGMEYSNFAVTLLGYVLARQAGQSYAGLVDETICAPLGMTDTRTRVPENARGRVAKGYRLYAKWGPVALAFRADPWTSEPDTEGAGGHLSSGRDMLRYLRANMRPEETPLAPVLRASHQPLHTEDEQTGIGMAWMRAPEEQGGGVVIWHNGGTGGFSSFLAFTGDGRRGVVVLANAQGNVDDIGLAILRDASRRKPPVTPAGGGGAAT